MSLPGNIGILARMPTPASSLYGNVDGPASATDNALVRFDGTTGKLIQNSVLIVADTTGALSGFTTGVGITFHGDGTLTGASGALTLTASGTNQNIAMIPSGTGYVQVSPPFASGAGELFRVSRTISATNATAGVVSFELNVSGTPAAGFGPGNVFYAKSSTTERQPQGGVETYWTDATHATRTAAMSFNTVVNGTYSKTLVVSGGTAATLTGGAGNMTIAAGTGASRTLALQTTTSGSVATTALTLGDAQQATFTGALITTPQDLSGAGAINITTTSTAYTSTGGAQALTLADGVPGQIKTICHVVDGGSGVLTPTTKSGYTTITFTNVGDSVALQFHATAGWCIVGIFGAVAA